jgi:hypothetical protein
MATPTKITDEKKVRRLARKVVGIVPPSHAIQPKSKRKKPKHKKPLEVEPE